MDGGMDGMVVGCLVMGILVGVFGWEILGGTISNKASLQKRRNVVGLSRVCIARVSSRFFNNKTP